MNNYNCSDFGIEVAEKSGLNLPNTTSIYEKPFFKFEGRNPADLGEDIRNMNLPQGASRNTSGGNAPSKKGGC